MDQAALLRRRRRNFRQLPSQRVRSARSALAFVEAVGLCSTFHRFPEGLGCLWEAGFAPPRLVRRDGDLRYVQGREPRGAPSGNRALHDRAAVLGALCADRCAATHETSASPIAATSPSISRRDRFSVTATSSTSSPDRVKGTPAR